MVCECFDITTNAGGRRNKEEEVASVQYMEVIALLDTVQRNLGCICLNWFISDELDQNDCNGELKYGLLKVGEW